MLDVKITPRLARSELSPAAATGASRPDTRDAILGLIDLYITWHAAGPGKGYDAKAAGWKAKRDAIMPAASATSP